MACLHCRRSASERAATGNQPRFFELRSMVGHHLAMAAQMRNPAVFCDALGSWFFECRGSFVMARLRDRRERNSKRRVHRAFAKLSDIAVPKGFADDRRPPAIDGQGS